MSGDLTAIGRIVIAYTADETGHPIVTVETDDMDLVTMLGMLRLTEDTLIREAMGEAVSCE